MATNSGSSASRIGRALLMCFAVSLALYSFWFRAPWRLIFWDFIGGLLVAGACIGEWMQIAYSGDSPEKRIEKGYAVAIAIGVSIELICTMLAAAETIQSAREIEQLRHENLVLEAKLKDIANQTPARLPVTQVAANCQFDVPARTILKTEQLNAGHSNGFSAQLMLRGTNGPVAAKLPLLILISDKVETWGDRDVLTVALTFRLLPMIPGIPRSVFESAAGDLMDQMASGHIFAPFLPENTHVFGGSVSLMLNGLSKRFTIPPQDFYLMRTNSASGEVHSHWMIECVSPAKN